MSEYDAITSAEIRGFVSGMVAVALMLAIFLGGIAVGRGLGRVPSEAVEKEGGR